MRNIATCYSEHAVRVSDSYCSGPINRSSSYISPKSIPSVQNAVTRTYKAKLDHDQPIFITITWCNKLICQGFFIKVSKSPSSTSTKSGPHHLHHHQMSRPKGHKFLEVKDLDGSSIQVRWDLSGAKFEIGPEPISEFYVGVSVDTRLVLLLGNDQLVPNEYGLLLSQPMIDNSLVSQYEHFYGQWNGQVSTRARFRDTGNEHDIMVRCSPEDDGPRNPVLSVFLDKKRVFKVNRLQWNFRGNQVIFVDNLLVDVMWDVYGWFFDQTVNSGVGGSKNGCGVFMFRTRSGLDSRLWLEEEEKKLADRNHDRPEFSLLICVSSKNPS